MLHLGGNLGYYMYLSHEHFGFSYMYTVDSRYHICVTLQKKQVAMYEKSPCLFEHNNTCTGTYIILSTSLAMAYVYMKMAYCTCTYLSCASS